MSDQTELPGDVLELARGRLTRQAAEAQDVEHAIAYALLDIAESLRRHENREDLRLGRPSRSTGGAS